MSCDPENRNSSDDDAYGPIMLPKDKPENAELSKKIIGPSLPPTFNRDEKTEESDEEDCFGPALPPHLLKRKREEYEEEKVEKNSVAETEQTFNDNKSDDTNDDDDNDDDNNDDDNMIGPVPADCASSSFAQQKLEERAWRLKNDFLNKNTTVENKREEWMMELPPAHSVASIGLGPRKFKTREGPDMSDRSCWTDTPADRERKRQEMLNKASFEQSHKKKKKDKERHEDRKKEKKSKKKEKSLLELHQEKLRKEKKKAEKEAKEAGRTLRRPFDRDIDLKIGGMTEKAKKSIFAKSQLLDDRFCHGKM